MDFNGIVQVIWNVLNSPAVIVALAGGLLWLLNRLYAAKPAWQAFEGTIIRVLLPWVVNRSRPTAKNADPDRQTRDRLRAKIRKHWGTAKPDGEDGWGKP